MEAPTLGLALGGGGARGYAHIGVLRVLQRHEIPVRAVAGTSIGAVIGAAFAAGIDLDRLQCLLKELDLNRLLHFPRHSLRGLISNTATDVLAGRPDWRRHELPTTQSLIEFFGLFSRHLTFEELGIPLAVVATDIDTGERVVLRQGPIDRALAATVSLPGIHYPVQWADRYLVDGGLVDNLPVAAATDLGAERVLAVDVEAPLEDDPALTSMDVLLRAERILLRELNRLRLEQDGERMGDRLAVIHPHAHEVGTLDLGAVDGPIQAGEAEAERQLAQIRALLAESPS
ncbi:MAG: patatin-like phospholipase family protein [Candidatus Bipolaricaulia bacterium]